MSLRTLRSLPLLIAAAFLLFAVPASAGGWHKHHRKHHHEHHRHHHGCGHGSYDAPSYVVRHSYGYPVYHHGYGPEAYYCGPCGNHFDSYDDLSYHVHDHHHVAVLELPSVIFQASIGGGIGWVFGH